MICVETKNGNTIDLSEYLDDIRSKIYKFQKKFKQPNIYSYEDLQQEVFMSLIICFERWYDPAKSSIRTFLNQRVHCCLYDILQKTYKNVDINDRKSNYTYSDESLIDFLDILNLNDHEIKMIKEFYNDENTSNFDKNTFKNLKNKIKNILKEKNKLGGK